MRRYLSLLLFIGLALGQYKADVLKLKKGKSYGGKYIETLKDGTIVFDPIFVNGIIHVKRSGISELRLKNGEYLIGSKSEKNKPSKEITNLFNYGKTHLGIEYDLFEYLFIDIWKSNNYENSTNLEGVNIYGDEEDYFDDYWSIQYTIKDKYLLRYTSFDLNKGVKGPIGSDQSYIIDNSDSPQHEFSFYEGVYFGSGQQTISKVLSVGYPIKLSVIEPNYFNYFRGYQIDLIMFIGFSYNVINEMDVYRNSEWIGQKVFFVDSYESVRFKDSKTEIKPSIGLSLPLMGYFQTSIIYNGSDYKIMFGIGI